MDYALPYAADVPEVEGFYQEVRAKTNPLGLRGLDAFERFPERPGQEIDLRQPEKEQVYWSPMTRTILGVTDDHVSDLTGGFQLYEAESRQKLMSQFIQE